MTTVSSTQKRCTLCWHQSVADNWTEKTSDAQRTFLLVDVDEIEVGVVLFADDIMVEAEEEAVFE